MENKEKVTMKRSTSNERRQQITLMAIIVFLFVVLSFVAKNFIKIENLTNVIHNMSVLAIMSYGMTVVLICGGVDLSMGFLIAFSGIMAALVVQNGERGPNDGNVILAIVIGILTGSAVGLVNGVSVAVLGLPPYIATLATQMMLRGLSYLISLGPIYLHQDDNWFRTIASTRLFGVVPLPFIYVLVIGFALYFFLRKTILGRRFYAIGSNGEAARLSGINLVSTRIWAYVVASSLAAMAGVVQAARTNSGAQTAGQGMEGDAMVAAVMGGTSMGGGHGTLFGAVIGAFFMTLIRNGLNLLKVNPQWQYIVIGVMLIFAVFIDKIRRERAMNTLSE